MTTSSRPASLLLDRPSRIALRADGVIALVVGTSAFVSAPLLAGLLELPALLFLGAAVALIPYGVRALQSGFARGEVAVARVEGLTIFNLVVVMAVSAALLGGFVQPNVWGSVYLASWILVPATVAACTLRTLVLHRSRVVAAV